jgi:hypothetical protein
LSDVAHYDRGAEELDLETPFKRRKHEETPVARTSNLTLALRPMQRETEAEIEQHSDDDGFTTVIAPQEQTSEAIAHELEHRSGAESDYDIVSQPSDVEALSTDDESDSAVIGEGHAEEGGRDLFAVPIRARAAENATGANVTVDSDWDSEWTEV